MVANYTLIFHPITLTFLSQFDTTIKNEPITGSN